MRKPTAKVIELSKKHGEPVFEDVEGFFTMLPSEAPPPKKVAPLKITLTLRKPLKISKALLSFLFTPLPLKLTTHFLLQQNHSKKAKKMTEKRHQRQNCQPRHR